MVSELFKCSLHTIATSRSLATPSPLLPNEPFLMVDIRDGGNIWLFEPMNKATSITNKTGSRIVPHSPSKESNKTCIDQSFAFFKTVVLADFAF